MLMSSLTSNAINVSVNPLTTLVDAQAVGNVQNNSQDVANALNDATLSTEESYGLTTDPSTIFPDFTSAGVGTDSGRLGLILGTFINEDQSNCASSPGGLVTALAADYADGVFDGQSFGTPMSYCAGSLPASAGTTQFADALSGQQGLTMVPRAFTFGGTNNTLTNNGVSASDVSADASTIVTALVQTGPSGPLMFAPTPLPTMTAERADHTASLLQTGNVLIAGGLSSTGVLNSAELFDPATRTFTSSTSSMVSARQDMTATLLPNGKILLAGGYNGTNNLSSAEVYDPIADTFTATANNMSSPRRFANAALLSNGLVLIAGGGTNTSDLYNPAANTFTAGPTMVSGRSNASATLLPMGRVLIAGGFNGGPLSSAELYDPSANSFTATGNNMIVARGEATALLLPNGKVLVAGGSTGSPSGALNTAELFNPSAGGGAGMFSLSSSTMIEARQQATSALLPNGNVLIAGGMGTSGPLTDAEVYLFASDTFVAVGNSMNSPRSNAASVLLQNGAVLITGGVMPGGALNTIDICAPAP